MHRVKISYPLSVCFSRRVYAQTRDRHTECGMSYTGVHDVPSTRYVRMEGRA